MNVSIILTLTWFVEQIITRSLGFTWHRSRGRRLKIHFLSALVAGCTRLPRILNNSNPSRHPRSASSSRLWFWLARDRVRPLRYASLNDPRDLTWGPCCISSFYTCTRRIEMDKIILEDKMAWNEKASYPASCLVTWNLENSEKFAQIQSLETIEFKFYFNRSVIKVLLSIKSWALYLNVKSGYRGELWNSFPF